MFGAFAVAMFFALLALPGFALLRRFHRPLLGEGVLAAIGPSYLASFALLTPVSVLGYALRWPIGVLSAAYVAALAVALVTLWREPWSAAWSAAWPVLRAPRWPQRPSWLVVVVWLLIVGDLVLAARVGGHALGDGYYHLGRIRSLVDHGLQSWDPLSPAHTIDAAYHTNLYHALLAVAAQVCGLKGFDVWAYALPWAKLMSAAAIYRFALVAVGKPGPALAATACAVLWSLARTTFVYPNALAPYALLPLALSFGLELGRRETRLRGAIGLGLSSLALAQVHALYYVYLCLALGPCLLVVLGAIQRDVRALALCVVLLAGAPWVAYSALHRSGGAHQDAAETRATVVDSSGDGEEVSAHVKRSQRRRERDRGRGFLSVGDDQLAAKPSALWNPLSTRFQLLAALALGLVLTRRRELGMLAGVVLTLLLVLHVPWLCSALVRLAGAPWIVRRMVGVLQALTMGTVPAVLAYAIAGASSAWPRLALALCVALGYGQIRGIDSGAWKRRDVVADAFSGAPLRQWLGSQRRRGRLLGENVPAGGVLATSLGRGRELAAVCDCYPLALLPEHGTHGMRDMEARRSALHRILDPRTPTEERLTLMRRYGTRHVYLGRTKKTRRLKAALADVLVDSKRSGSSVLLTVDTARVLTPAQAPP